MTPSRTTTQREPVWKGNPQLKPLLVPLEGLAEDPDNARLHLDDDVAALARSLQRFGQQKAFVAHRDGTMLAGNGGLRAARTLGWTHLAVVRTNLHGDQARAYAIADNRTAELSAWNDDALAKQLQHLQAEGLLDAAAFDELALQELLSTDAEADVVEDEAPPPPAKPRTQPGDLWLLGEHRTLCGDSTKPGDVARALGGERFAVLFTDPPYGVAYEAEKTSRGKHDGRKKKWRPIENDALEGAQLRGFFEAFLEALLPRGLPDAAYYLCIADRTRRSLEDALEGHGVYQAVPLVWVKQAAPVSWHRYHPQHEVILYGGPGAKPTGKTSRWHGPKNETTVWHIDRDPSGRYAHPTQKPVALPARAIRNSTAPGELVLDAFLGSGSTLMAAEQLGRRLVGIEQDPAYVDVAVQRWERYTGQKARRERRR